jgi:hypothetical protein
MCEKDKESFPNWVHMIILRSGRKRREREREGSFCSQSARAYSEAPDGKSSEEMGLTCHKDRSREESD